MNRMLFFFITCILCATMPISGFSQQDKDKKEKKTTSVKKAIAVLHPTQGNTASGTVIFTKEENGILIQAELSGLSEGMHGFHIHEYGDCSAPDGTSAGGHFNPDDSPHAGPEDKPRHVGDLGNVEVNTDGTASYERLDEVISFTGDSTILGRAVIVHEKEDDLSSQPTGDAGGRLTCGVIGIAGAGKK